MTSTSIEAIITEVFADMTSEAALRELMLADRAAMSAHSQREDLGVYYGPMPKQAHIQPNTVSEHRFNNAVSCGGRVHTSNN